MDHEWARQTLEAFASAAEGARYEEEYSPESVDRSARLEPVVQRIMNVYERGLGDYETDDTSLWTRWNGPRERALRAAGLAENFEDIQKHLQPDSPYIAGDSLHPWVWAAAQPMWEAEARQESVNTAARAVNARIQQKSGRHDISESDLVMQVFDLNKPEPGKPRLRLPGDRTKASWKSQQEGVRFFGAGCFRAIRNPAAHEEAVNWSEQETLEYLAALSALSRWVETSIVESV